MGKIEYKTNREGNDARYRGRKKQESPDRKARKDKNKNHSNNKNKSTSHNVRGVEERQAEIKGIIK